MDCTQAKELMWETDLPEEFFEHIESCPECKKEYELIKKTKTALASKDDMTCRILVAAMMEKRRRLAARIIRVAAVFLVVLSVGIFARLAIDSGLKFEQDSAENFAPALDYDAAESVTGTTNGFFDGGTKDEYFEVNEPASPEDSFMDSVITESEAVEEEAPVAEDMVFDDDVSMLMNVYKDMHGLSYHTADIIVSGDDTLGASDALEELGARMVDSHIEIEGDFYFEAQELLTRAGFDVLFVSSSESVNKTLVYFEELIK